jgi:hypothetical protein
LSSTRSVNTVLCLLFSQFREFLLQYKKYIFVDGTELIDLVYKEKVRVALVYVKRKGKKSCFDIVGSALGLIFSS